MPPLVIDQRSLSQTKKVSAALESLVAESPVPVVIESKRPPMQIVWINVFYFSVLHIMAVIGFFTIPWAHPLTWLVTGVTYIVGALGITAGAHRLWAHKAYKANLPLRVLLMIFNFVSMQNDVIEWSRDHRVHHKCSETDADPHNATRGFFFSHVGWLLVKKHPDVKEKGKKIDLSDLYADPVLVMQRRFYLPGILLFCVVLPTFIPWYFWGESFLISYFLAFAFRYVLSLNVTWFVNSAAHMWGNRPYDNSINPAQNFFVSFGAIGEGFHNYHHVFPSDYSASEYGWRVNMTTLFIDFMALFGWAYDRKKMSKDAVDRRATRTGDGTTGFGYFESDAKNC